MDSLGWIFVIILLFLFGQGTLANLTATFTQPNAVPTPDGIPASSNQNQNLLVTANAPPPWHKQCTNLPVSPSLPLLPIGGITSSPFTPPVNVKGTAVTPQRVTFMQGVPLSNTSSLN